MTSSTTAMAATTTAITPTSAPAIVPAGDSLMSEPGFGRKDNTGVEVTGSGVLPGFGGVVDTRSPVLLLTGTVVPEIEIYCEG